jgi:hypothetical protein
VGLDGEAYGEFRGIFRLGGRRGALLDSRRRDEIRRAGDLLHAV